jgi:predicted ATPase/DNA-binding XRE family transcriptional regulator
MNQVDSFGDFVRRRRRALDLTQIALAERVGCAESLIRKIESEERRPSRQIAERLAAALQIAPTDQELFVRIARGAALPERLSVSTESNAAPPQPAHAASASLPVPLTPLVGREAELGALDRLLADDGVRLLVIVAPGGMGKTRLALAVAAGQQGAPRFLDGVHFVDLGTLKQPELLAASLVANLALPGGHDQGLAEARLCHYLAGRRMLLVLDNAEHLRGAVPLLDAILRAAPGVALLVTSRERLGLHGEQLFPLGGLIIPADPALAKRSDATQLFLQAARRVRPLWQPSAEDYLAIRSICRLVGGMPLAIELTGAWAAVLPPPTILAELRRSWDLLTTATRELPERQRSVRAVLDAAWQQMRPQLRDVFARLAVFQGGFTREAAAAVSNASLADLADLASAALVHHYPERDRYLLHELLRAYAAERLGEDAAVAAEVRAAYANFFCDYVAHYAPELRGAGAGAARRALEDEQENIEAAWHHAVERRLFALLDRVTQPLGQFYELRADTVRGAAAFDEAVAHLGEDNTVASLLRAHLLTWRSAFLRPLGQLAEAEWLARRAIELLDGDAPCGEAEHAARAHAYTRLATAIQAQRGADARAAYEAALAGYRATRRTWEESYVLYHLAGLSADLGQLSQAMEYGQASFALREASGDKRSLAHTLQLLSQLQLTMGELDTALVQAEECYIAFEQLGEEAGIAKGLRQRGIALYWHGRFAEALALAEQSAAIYDDLGLTIELGNSQTLTSLACTALGRAEAAEAAGQAAIALHHTAGLLAHDHTALGLALLAQDRHTAAEQALRASLALHQQIGRRIVPLAKPYLALCMLHQNKLEVASELLAEALRASSRQHAFQPTLLALVIATPILVARQDERLATAALVVGGRFPVISDDALLRGLLRPQESTLAAQAPARAAAPTQHDELWAVAQSIHDALRESRR